MRKSMLKIFVPFSFSCQIQDHTDLSPTCVIRVFSGKKYASGGTLHAKSARQVPFTPMSRSSLKMAHTHWFCRLDRLSSIAHVCYTFKSRLLNWEEGKLSLRNNSNSRVISLRVPNDLYHRLPQPLTGSPGKMGVGRNGAIIEMLRKALDEKQPDGGENSSPAFSSN